MVTKGTDGHQCYQWWISSHWQTHSRTQFKGYQWNLWLTIVPLVTNGKINIFTTGTIVNAPSIKIQLGMTSSSFHWMYFVQAMIWLKNCSF